MCNAGLKEMLDPKTMLHVNKHYATSEQGN